MDFDFSWKALVKPGSSDRYFDLTAVKEFEIHVKGYSAVNAWWLSELSRLVYRHGKERKGEAPVREDILKEAGFSEIRTFIREGNHFCSLIVSERDNSSFFAVLAFRGTTGIEGWFSNFNVAQTPWDEGGLVHSGFMYDFLQLWDEVEEALSSLDIPVFYTGHSLGGAFATLASSKRPPEAVYSFGSPRVGDSVFADSLRHNRLYRVVNNQDIFTTVPLSGIPLDYCHAGEQINLPDYGISCTSNSIPRFLTSHSSINYTAGIERMLQEPLRNNH
ncbi:MAG: lipase family protein [Desulfobacteraceae bacterium]|nr:MAG: lipase family protein [Desulfobacteraceae bacterium]